jgi:excisionase family DNA binding protein
MTIKERLASSDYLSPTEAASIIGVCVETVLIQLRSGRLKGSKVGDTRLWRIDPHDLAEFMRTPQVSK